MFSQFTDRARKVMALANQEAHQHNHEYIASEHVLLALLSDETAVGAKALLGLGVDPKALRAAVEQRMPRGGESVTAGKRPQWSSAKNIIVVAINEARGLGHNYVGTEHLLLGLVHENSGLAAQILQEFGVELPKAREAVLNLLAIKVEPDVQTSKQPFAPEPPSHDPVHVAAILLDAIRMLLSQLAPLAGRSITMEMLLRASIALRAKFGESLSYQDPAVIDEMRRLLTQPDA